MSQPTRHSYGQIFDSSLLIGGSSLVTVLAQVARTKLIAVFLGPAGLGLMGLFGSTTSLAGTVTAMGITTSGVREIADAAGVGDELRVARTVSAIRWILVRLGLLGSALLAVFCVPVSRLTFGTADHAGQIALLSGVIAAGAIADGQVVLLQGLRRIADIARIAILAATASVALTLPIVYLLQQDAVVPLLIAASAAGLAASWWYARRIDIAPVPMTWRMAWQESQAAAPARARVDVCRPDGRSDRVRRPRHGRTPPGHRGRRRVPRGDGAVGRVLRVHPVRPWVSTFFRGCRRSRPTTGSATVW